MFQRLRNSSVCRAKNLTTNKVGCVKMKLIMPVNSIELEPWYFGSYSKIAAEKQLFKESYRTGTFLIRKNDNEGNYIF